MTEMIKICAIFAVAAFMSFIIKGTGSNTAHLIAITCTVFAGAFAAKNITPILEYTNSIGTAVSDVIQILLRVLGISYITEITSSLCKDTGETSLASGIELIGKVEMVVISFPLFQQLIILCTDYLQ